ncbi:putative AAA family ATPase [Blumeria hordei DH14]|uniref:Putative AAA family ATPase n=1 Tax=Blumeria graminis f. sp. hordei (strain DH14) TaxID=546991 RepID=N1JDB1_BLUG1|nr:putative AAA family ATPase [Blumeria hordei DH14]
MWDPERFTLQKTYDECHLVSSTAFFFEGQGNDVEALRSWRSALGQIYHHNAYRMPTGYLPKTETERTLHSRLQSMEAQCKEHINLLESPKKSQATSFVEGVDSGDVRDNHRRSSHGSSTRVLEVGDGDTSVNGVAEINTCKLTIPQNLAMCSNRFSGDNQSVNTFSRAVSNTLNNLHFRLIGQSRTLNVALLAKGASRGPGPEKARSMRQTLRTSDKGGKKAFSHQIQKDDNKYNVTSTAASLAWKSSERLNKDKKYDGSDDCKRTSPYCYLGYKDGLNGNLQGRSDKIQSFQHNSRADALVRQRSNDFNSRDNHNIESNAEVSRDISENDSQDMTAKPKSHSLQDLKDFGSLLVEPRSSKSSKSTQSSHCPNSQKRVQKISYPSCLKETYISSDTKPCTGHEIVQIRKNIVRGRLESDNSPIRLQNNNMDNPNFLISEDLDAYKTKSLCSYNNELKFATNHNLQIPPRDKKFNANSSKGLIRTDINQKAYLKNKSVTKKMADLDSKDLELSFTNIMKDVDEINITRLLKALPKGVDEMAARQIFNEIVDTGDEVHWDDVAGLDIAKTALKEAVVYPFLRPDLFMGLREPARGMLLFGPPGTGKTMLARAVATESKSTFFSISSSILTTKIMAPSIIFVDEIDSLLSSRESSGNESTRRIKTEFLIQWSDLQRAAVGRPSERNEKEQEDTCRVLVLAATNIPWAIDEAARRRFVRRQYIPLPEEKTRESHLKSLLSHQKHDLENDDIERLVNLTKGFSGSDLTALAKDAAMGPLRSLGEDLLVMKMDEIRPISFSDFEASLNNIKPSVSPARLKKFEDWAKVFGERGG